MSELTTKNAAWTSARRKLDRGQRLTNEDMMALFDVQLRTVQDWAKAEKFGAEMGTGRGRPYTYDPVLVRRALYGPAV